MNNSINIKNNFKAQKLLAFFENKYFFKIYNEIINSGFKEINDSSYFEYDFITKEEFFSFFDSIFYKFETKSEDSMVCCSDYVEYEGLVLRRIYGHRKINSIVITDKVNVFKNKKKIEDF